MRAFELEAFNIANVKDVPLPLATMEAGSFRCVVDSLMRNPPGVVVIDNPMTPEIPFGGSEDACSVGKLGYQISQVNGNHARSFRVEHPALDNGTSDEYGNLFTSFTLKGNNFSFPGLIGSSTAQHDVMAYGLQESVGMRRVLRASNQMRRLGVSTEYIIGLSEPKILPYIDAGKKTDEVQLLGRNAYKQKLAFDHWSQLGEEEKTLESLSEIRRAIDGTAYYISIRAMDSDYRLSDFMTDPDISKGVRELLSENEEPISIEEYFTEHLLPTAARNFALMHAGGLAHRFPHHGNISALGSIVDLDSVYGETLELDDDPITTADMSSDIEYFLHGFNGTKTPGVTVLDIIGVFMTTYIEKYTKIGNHDSSVSLDIIKAYRERLGDPSMPSGYILADRHKISEEALDEALKKHLPDISAREKEHTEAAKEGLVQALELESAGVEEMFLEYILEHPQGLVDPNFMNLVNEYNDLLKGGHGVEAMTSLFEREYSELYEGAAELAPHFLVDLASDNQTIDFEAVLLLSDEFARKVVFANAERVAGEIGAFLNDARVEDDILLGDATVSYLSGKGNMIYDACVDDLEILRSIILDPDKETRVATVDPSTTNHFTYTAGENVQLLEVVVFDASDYDGSSYGYAAIGEIDSYDLGFSADRAVLFITKDTTSEKILYDVVTGDPELFSPKNVESSEDFKKRWTTNQRYVQERLFDPYKLSTELFMKNLGLLAVNRLK